MWYSDVWKNEIRNVNVWSDDIRNSYVWSEDIWNSNVWKIRFGIHMFEVMTIGILFTVRSVMTFGI